MTRLRSSSHSSLLESDGEEKEERRSTSDLRIQRTFWQRWIVGLGSWRGTVLVGTVITTCVLLVHISFLVWLVTTRDKVPGSDMYYIFSDKCEVTSRASVMAHLAINILSSLLLGASSFCIQALTSPTREDVDRTHRHGRWLSIGTFALRNLRVIPAKRNLISFLLAITSVPLAFLYNPIIIDMLATNSYRGVVVTQNIFTDGPRMLNDSSISYVDPMTWKPTCTDPADCNGKTSSLSGSTYSPAAAHWADISLFSNGQGGFREMKYLSVPECVNSYQSQWVTKYRNFMLVVNSTNTTQNILTNTKQYDELLHEASPTEGFNAQFFIPHRQICYRHCTYYDPENNTMVFSLLPEESILDVDPPPDPLRPERTVTIDHCLVEEVDSPCSLGASLTLLIVVIVLNSIKALCLFFALASTSFKPLLTIGDALITFIAKPDPHTRNQSSLSLKDVQKGLWRPTVVGQQRRGRAWRNKRQYWAGSTSTLQWVVTTTLGGSMLIAGLATMPWTTMDRDLNFSTSGFGAPLQANLTKPIFIVGPTVLAVIANIPQIIISVGYMFYNNILTSMCLVREFGTYSTHRKSLRVSQPRGDQRTSYFLSIPFRYSVPFMISMMSLHWSVSQAFFPVYMTYYPADIDAASRSSDAQPISFQQLGFSPSATIISLCIGSIIFVSLPLLGLRKYPRGFVMAAHCSAALSAACHAETDLREFPSDYDVGARRLQYGVLPHKYDDQDYDGKQEPRRLGFSAAAVEPLIEGETYEAPALYSLSDKSRESRGSKLYISWLYKLLPS